MKSSQTKQREITFAISRVRAVRFLMAYIFWLANRITRRSDAFVIETKYSSKGWNNEASKGRCNPGMSPEIWRRL